MRSVELWTGTTDDAAIPPRVRLRVFERCAGRCWRCHRKIGAGDRWSIEHVVALCNGGRHAEDNMAVSCAWCKPVKDAEDAAIKRHGTVVRYRHAGIRPEKARLKSQGFAKAAPQRRASTPHHKHIGQFDADISKSER